MKCEDFENCLLGGVEDRLSADERGGFEAHLAGCPLCRAFARQLGELDAALVRGIKAPELPAAFTAQLHRRIQAETVLLSEAQQLERKRQMQAEFEAGLAELRKHSLAAGGLLNHLMRAVAIGLVGCLVLAFMLIAANSSSQPGTNPADQNLVLCWTTSVSVLLIGLSLAFPRPLRRLRQAMALDI